LSSYLVLFCILVTRQENTNLHTYKLTSWLPTKTTCVSLCNNYVLTESINAITLDGGLAYPNKFQFLVSFEIHKYLFWIKVKNNGDKHFLLSEVSQKEMHYSNIYVSLTQSTFHLTFWRRNFLLNFSTPSI
jgi:hypothetical protein